MKTKEKTDERFKVSFDICSEDEENILLFSIALYTVTETFPMERFEVLEPQDP